MDWRGRSFAFVIDEHQGGPRLHIEGDQDVPAARNADRTNTTLELNRSKELNRSNPQRGTEKI
jgi:hypothetical protein